MSNLLVMRSAAEREALCIKFMPTARGIARAWGRTQDTFEEALSDCYLKLVQVIDATPGVPSAAYIAESLRNTLRDGHSREIAGSRIPTSNLISLDAPINGGDALRDEHLSGHDVVADPKSMDFAAEAISSHFVHQMLIKLPLRQRKLISRLAGLDGMDARPMTEVAKGLRISRVTAYKDLEAALATLRAELLKQGIHATDNTNTLEVLRAA